MPLSNDPEKRAAQVANLRQGAGEAGAGVGNLRAVSHGAYARVTAPRLDVKTRQIVDALSADAPVRAADGSLPAADAAAARLLAETLCRLETIGDYLERRGWEGEDGRPRPVLEYEARLRSQALDLMKEFGMTPASRMKLGLDLARAHKTLEEEIADGRDAWERRESIDATVAANGEQDGPG